MNNLDDSVVIEIYFDYPKNKNIYNINIIFYYMMLKNKFKVL